MNYVTLIGRHIWLEVLEHVRQPMYLVSTMLFPGMFFWFFGVPNATEEAPARLLTASFSVFAILGVVFFQFALTIAGERGTPWAAQLRLLPVPGFVPLTGRLVANILFSMLAIFCVFAISRIATPANLPLNYLIHLTTVLCLGAVPFGFAGLALGLLTSPRTVVPVANMIYLPLSFAGGLWLPPNALPKVIQDLSPYLPTRMLGEVAWSILLEKELPVKDIRGLVFYTLVMAGLALWLYHKDLEKTYG